MEKVDYEGFEDYNNDDIVCTCAYISRKEILNILQKYAIKDIDEITELTGAGGGCGFCRDDLEQILKSYNKQNKKNPDH